MASQAELPESTLWLIQPYPCFLKKLYLPILWASYKYMLHIMNISTTPLNLLGPPNISLSQIHVLCLSSLLLISYYIQLVLPIYAWVWSHSLNYGLLIRGHKPKVKQFSVPKPSSTANNISTRGESSWAPPLIPAGIFIWLNIMQILCRKLQWKVTFHRTLLNPPALTFLPFPPLQCSLSIRRARLI